MDVLEMEALFTMIRLVVTLTVQLHTNQYIA